MVTLRGYVFENRGYTSLLMDVVKANVLIDEDKHARLADFGLLTIIPDTNLLSSVSFTPGGTHQWMSPELFYPERFGLKAACPTKHSDCYALGMLIYEVLSGEIPFPGYNGYAVAVRVVEGERPGRPEGAIGTWFTDEVWGVLGSCWKHTPRDRPRIGDVLQCLENTSRSWIPTSRTTPGPQPMDSSTGGLESSTEEPTGDGESLSLSQGVSSHSPREQSKGDTDKSNI